VELSPLNGSRLLIHLCMCTYAIPSRPLDQRGSAKEINNRNAIKMSLIGTDLTYVLCHAKKRSEERTQFIAYVYRFACSFQIHARSSSTFPALAYLCSTHSAQRCPRFPRPSPAFCLWRSKYTREFAMRLANPV